MLTVITPPAFLALTTQHAAQRECGLLTFGFVPDLSAPILQASGMVADFCGRPLPRWGRQRVQESFRLGLMSPPRSVPLSVTPVVSLVSVTENGAPLDLSTDVELDQESGILRRIWGDADGAWCGRVLVTYDGGWLLPGQQGRTLPGAVERAALETVRSIWFATDVNARDPRLRSTSAEGTGSTSWLDPQAGAEELPPTAAAILQRYRQIGIS